MATFKGTSGVLPGLHVAMLAGGVLPGAMATHEEASVLRPGSRVAMFVDNRYG